MMTSSSEGLAFQQQSVDVDSWLISDPFSNDNDLFSKAIFDSTTVSDLSPPQTLSNVSFVSDPEIAGGSGTKRKRSEVKPVKRRRSRVSVKKSQTTFITADVSSFREMVQQVTGAKFIGSSSFSPIFKPEPYRLPPCKILDNRSSAIPTTLDTSSFLSNYHQKNLLNDLGSDSKSIGSFHQSSEAATTTTMKAADGGGGGGGSAVELDKYQSFPTLESWKVM